MTTLFDMTQVDLSLPGGYLDVERYQEYLGLLPTALQVVGYGDYGPGGYINGRSGWFYRVTADGSWLHLRESISHDYKITHGSPPPFLQVYCLSGEEQAKYAKSKAAETITTLTKNATELEEKLAQYSGLVELVGQHSPELGSYMSESKIVMEGSLSDFQQQIVAVKAELESLGISDGPDDLSEGGYVDDDPDE